MSHRGEHCLNCGALTPDAYCGQCGQKNADYRESLRELIGEVAEEVFQFDSRIVHTVVPFLVQPGKLTKEFVEGRRVRYSSPLRLFLFTSALYLVAGWIGPGRAPLFEVRGKNNNANVTIFSSEHGDAGTDDAQPLFVEDDGGLNEHPDGGETRLVAFERERLHFWSMETKGEAKLKASEFVLSNIPKAAFVLMPLFAVLLALLFRRPKRFYLEHFIFALHYHSFLFVLLALSELAPALANLLAIIAAVYLLLSLRRVYVPTIFQLVWKLLALVLLYAFILLLALALLFVAAFAFA